jgi:branched-chain amino acid transport system substrate-binding protein
MQNLSRRQLLQAAAAASLAGAAGCKKKSNGVTVGLYLSLTGDKADFGISTRNGVQLALDETNAAGGLLGYPVRAVAEDTRGDSNEAASAVTRLIDREHVCGIIGEVASSLSLSGGRICQRRGIPMISPSSTNPAVTQIGDNVFRVCFLDPFQGDVMARFAKNSLHVSRVGIFKDQGSAYSTGLADAFRTSFTGLGGQIVDEQSYRAADTHFSAQISSLLARQPEALFVPGYYSEVALIAREVRGAGFQGRLLGGDGWSSNSLVQRDDDKLVGDFYSEGFAPEGATTPVAQRFVRTYREKYRIEPNGLAALGYDAALVMFDAIRRAGSAEPAQIKTAIAATRGLSGATGVITLNAQRDAVKSAVILEVRENAIRYRETVNPT